MAKNNAVSLIRRQSGYSMWRDTDTAIKRLRCTKRYSYTQLLPPRDVDEFYRDTPIFTCKFCPQESHHQLVALANEDGKLAIHDCNSNSRFGIQAHNNAIFDLAWMFDEMKLVTASGDHTSKLYDIGDGEIREERSFCGHTRSVKTVAFRKDDPSVFATGGRDGNIILWDTRTDTNSFVGKADRTIKNSHISKVITPSKSMKKSNTPTQSGIKSVTGLVFQENNTLISCGGGDGLIKIWDLRKNYVTYKREAAPKSLIPYSGNTTKNGYSSLLIDSSGIKLYANCLDNTIYCYNVGTYNTEPIMRYTGHQNSTFYVKSSLCKHGTYLLSGSSDENAYIWNTKQSHPLVKLTGHTAEVTCVGWCNNARALITCSDDMTHKIWTIGPEELPEDWDISGRGLAEVLPREGTSLTQKLKRALSDIGEEQTPKKLFVECRRCSNATSSKFCENCAGTLKRKNVYEPDNASKSTQTDFGPRRLFATLNQTQISSLAKILDHKDIEVSENQYEPPNKICRLLSHEPDYASLIHSSELLGATSNFRDWEEEPPNKLSKLEDTPKSRKIEETSSPTVNLPNFVVDGVAPHLNYSPPKKKCQDWLTRMRIEQQLRQDMYNKTVGASSTKFVKIEGTPKSRRCSSPKSPLLRYFKVTNNVHKCDGMNCTKYHSCSNTWNNFNQNRN